MLTKKDVPFLWGTAQEEAFTVLKDKLTHVLFLYHHYLSGAHLSGLHRALLLPWHQHGTQVILFVVVVREEDIWRENANLSV